MDKFDSLMTSVSSSGSEPVGDGENSSAPDNTARNARAICILRILVVDDLADAANSLARLLRHMGHELATAYDGPAALRKAETFCPQVVFLDIGLPGLDGYEVAKRLRENAITQSACLIALSGYGQESDVAQARLAGFDQHLLKPINMEKVEEVLAAAAARFA